ncbi:MAG TPA: methionine synthase, partial [Candidatus Binatia bacterium]|nr:methionine synthase [Candidatus Binatia bacterium]
NQGSRWLSQGGYEAISRELFRKLKLQRLLLEYDDERSGSFAPLREVPEDKFIVLGLITTKKPGLESLPSLTAKVTDASRYVPLERLAVSPQCGFASSIIGNNISLEDQRSKLRIVAETAGALWS